jgi:eukaryotic-like serine/threonine-protein kinase
MSKRAQTEDQLFAEALQRASPAARNAYLAEACGHDDKLRQRVEFLLRAHDKAGDFLDEPLSAETFLLRSEAVVATQRPGDRIGRYKLLEQVGEGGCGVVYVAEQEEPVRRRVALKVIKLGMDTRSVIARFEAERQALALMDHPNIAKVLDAGATETGRPFFVMELVRGIKITDYCDQANLSTQERLKLFIQVCSAIQHAHQKGIIHRDIKPSNILVTLHDGVPVPKVIDFGIAKATSDQRLTDKTVYTALEQFIGTPAYMSPEQAEMSGLDIDTRSDIYALGVLLYELLVGKPPFDPVTLLKAGVDQMRRIIREQEPARPSTRLSTLADADLTGIATHRNAEPPKLINSIRGDLDWIVMKCLEKDRTRRFETVNALALDIKRHLQNEPVAARPPSTLYRIQKTFHKHKVLFTASAAVTLAVLIGLAASTWLFLQEKEAHRRAVRAENDQIELRLQAERERLRAEAEKREALVQSANAIRERDRADQQVQRFRLQKAEEFFNADNTAMALGTLAHILRQDPGNRIAASRIISALIHRNFLVPRSPEMNSVRNAQFSRDGAKLAIVGLDGRLSIVDSMTGRPLSGSVSLPGKEAALDFSPDGTQLLVTFSNRVLFFDTAQLSIARDSGALEKPVLAAHFTPAGPAILVAQNSSAWLLHEDGSAWAGPWTNSSGFRSATFTPEGRLLSIRSVSGNQRLYDLKAVPMRLEIMSTKGPSQTFAFSADGNDFLTGAGSYGYAYLCRTTANGPTKTLLEPPGSAEAAVFSPDGRTLATEAEGVVRIWDVATAKLMTDAIRRDGEIRTFEFDPSGKRLLTSSWDRTIRLWHARTGKPASEELRFATLLKRVKMSPSGGLALLMSTTNAQVWDLRAGHALAKPVLNDVEHDTTQESPDGRYYFSTGGFATDGTRQVQIFDLKAGNTAVHRWLFQGAILCSRFSPDNQRLALGIGSGAGFKARDGGRVDVYDLATGDRVLELDTNANAVTALSFSDDSLRIATGNDRAKVSIWDAQTGAPLTPPFVHGTTGTIDQLQFSPDGALLLSVSGPSAALWNTKTGAKLFEIKHSGVIHSVAFRGDGRLIATAGNDRSVRLWNVENGRLWQDIQHDTPVQCATFSPEGERVATGTERGIARVWDVATGLPLTERLHVADEAVTGLRFTPDGNRLKTFTSSEAFLWDTPHVSTPAPVWLTLLAEAAGGVKFDTNMQVGVVPLRRHSQLKETIAALTNVADLYTRCAQWYFAERSSRAISPLSRMTLRQYVAVAERHEDVTIDADAAEQLAIGDAALQKTISNSVARLALAKRAREFREKGETLEWQGAYEEAAAAFREALPLQRQLHETNSTQLVETLDKLARVLHHKLNRPDEAEPLYREALAIYRQRDGISQQRIAEVLHWISRIAGERGDLSEAERFAREALTILKKSVNAEQQWVGVGDSAILNLAQLLWRQDKRREADELFQETAKRGNADLLNGLAWKLATANNNAERDGTNAALLAERAVTLTQRAQPHFIDTLATACAEMGDFEKAVALESEAIGRQKPKANEDFVKRLELFKARQPYRKP